MDLDVLLIVNIILGFTNLHSYAANLTKVSSLKILSNDGAKEIRLKRQAGYVYNKPNISFNLPTRPTQATTVDRPQPQPQQMYYAYPAPAPDGSINDVVNIGGTSGISTAGSSNIGGNGYSYGAQSATVTQATSTTDGGFENSASMATIDGSKSMGYNYGTRSGSQTFVGTEGSSSKGNVIMGMTGYNPSTSSLNTPAGVSTNAPKYLPPKEDVISTIDIQTPSQPISTGTTTTSTPAYSPPLTSGSPVTNIVMPSILSSSPLPTLNTGYLPPNPSTSPDSVSSVSPTQTPGIPTPGYLPPVTSSPTLTQTPVSTPAPTYLPPL